MKGLFERKRYRQYSKRLCIVIKSCSFYDTNQWSVVVPGGWISPWWSVGCAHCCVSRKHLEKCELVPKLRISLWSVIGAIHLSRGSVLRTMQLDAEPSGLPVPLRLLAYVVCNVMGWDLMRLVQCVVSCALATLLLAGKKTCCVAN